DMDDQVSNLRRLIDQVARSDDCQVLFLGGHSPVEASIEELLGPDPVECRYVSLLERVVPGQFDLQDFVLGVGALGDRGDVQDNQESGERQNCLHEKSPFEMTSKRQDHGSWARGRSSGAATTPARASARRPALLLLSQARPALVFTWEVRMSLGEVPTIAAAR